VTDSEKHPPVMIAGLKNAGKTAFICSLMQLGYRSKLTFAAIKPFDTGLLRRNAEELTSDGTLFCRNMTGEPMEILVSPYVANEDYPVEMAFRRDGIQINWGFLAERLSILGELYDQTLIEMPGGYCTPIMEQKRVADWMSELGYPLVVLLNAGGAVFEQNLAEIELLKGLHLDVEFVLNNTRPIENQDLMFFMWEKYEQAAEQEMAGMIPFVRNLDGAYDRLADKIATALPDLLDRLFQRPLRTNS